MREQVNGALYLTEREVAVKLGISVSTVRRWRGLRTGPSFVKLLGSIRYSSADLQNYLSARTVATHG